MKTVFALFALLFLIVIGISLSQNYFKDNPLQLPFLKTPTITIGKQTFKLYVAKSNKEKEIGLSEKKSLPPDFGMLFSFEKPDYYSFWMKNMQFPIDILFINGKKIVKIYQNVQPPTSKEESLPIYQSEKPADKVLEINSGLSQKYNFKEGDEVKIENL